MKNLVKNCVFNPNVDTCKWIKAAATRAAKTMAQTAIATIGTAAAMGNVDWKMVVSASALAGIISLLTSITGLPEVKTTQESEKR
mgnify:CR=1 FL=1